MLPEHLSRNSQISDNLVGGCHFAFGSAMCNTSLLFAQPIKGSGLPVDVELVQSTGGGFGGAGASSIVGITIIINENAADDVFTAGQLLHQGGILSLLEVTHNAVQHIISKFGPFAEVL